VRIFNNGQFDQGGRFYGGWWQNIPSAWRGLIVMDPFNTPTLEFDYSGLHVKLLYAKEGQHYEGDPYTIEGLPQYSRPILKLVLLVALNASNIDEAAHAIRQRINRDGLKWDEEQDMEIDVLIQTFRHFHEELNQARYFFSGYGVRLQYLDSQIAEYVMVEAMKEGIVILPVHDSFIFAEPFKDKVVKLMDTGYERLTGFNPEIEESGHSGKWTPLSEHMFKNVID
jgi:hypothetical protein